MKKSFVLVSVLLVLFISIFAGCKTTVPVVASSSFPDNCTILGRVTITTDSQHSGYHILLEEAKRKFPGTDDVVNIIVDAETKNYLFFVKYTYKMSGIAIKFN